MNKTCSKIYNAVNMAIVPGLWLSTNALLTSPLPSLLVAAALAAVGLIAALAGTMAATHDLLTARHQPPATLQEGWVDARQLGRDSNHLALK